MSLLSDNAEVCCHCDGEAFARISDRLPLLYGWYGSATVDLQEYVVLDAEVKRGPICDACATKLIEAGKVVLADPVDTLDEVSREVASALLAFGMEAIEVEITNPTEAANEVPCVPPVYFEKSDPLTKDLIDGLFGRSTGIDLVGIGQLMALASRARGRPLVGEARDAAIATYVDRLFDTKRMLPFDLVVRSREQPVA